MKKSIIYIYLLFFTFSNQVLTQDFRFSKIKDLPSFSISISTESNRHELNLSDVTIGKLNIANKTLNETDNPYEYLRNETYLNGGLLLSNFIGQFWINNNWEDRDKHIYAYNDDNYCIEMITQTGSAVFGLENISKTSLTYDNRKNVIEDVIQTWDGFNWQNSYKDNFSYNANNLIIEELAQFWDGADWVINGKTLFEYDNNNNLINKLYQIWGEGNWHNIQVQLYTYDENNNLIEYLYQQWDSTAWVNNMKGANKYDTKNNMVESYSQSWDGTNWKNNVIELYKYDEHNNNIEEVVTSWQDSAWVNSQKFKRTFEENNRMATWEYQEWFDTLWVGTRREIYKYDSQENTVERLFQFQLPGTSIWKDHFRWQWTYDIYNNITSFLWQTSASWLYNNNDVGWVNYDRVLYTNVPQNGVDGNVNNYWLANNYPNPFNNSTIIRYSIPKEEVVTIKIFNILGEEVELLVNESKQAGVYEVSWSPTNLSSGVYFYQLKAGDFIKVKKMILLK
jgi:hypothetical protein